MPPAARISDPTTHGSPLVPGPGSFDVIIGGMPAWRAILDQHLCPAVSISGADGVGAVMLGSPTVLINGMMACRMGDIVVEKPGLALGPANPIIMGCPTVMIGEVGGGAPGPASPGAAAAGGAAAEPMAAMSSAIGGESGASAGAMAGASRNGAATVPLAGNPGLQQALGAGPGTSTDPNKVWVEIELIDKNGKPVAGEPYQIVLPDGSTTSGSTDDMGRARVDGIDPGTCQVSFPSLDSKSWKAV